MIIDSWASATFASSSFRRASISENQVFHTLPLIATILPSFQLKGKFYKTDPPPTPLIVEPTLEFWRRN